MNFTNKIRNEMVDAGSVLADGGTLEVQAGSTTLVSIDLGADAFPAASSGEATSQNSLVGTATNSGTADSYEVYTSASELLWSGTVTETGNGGDLQLDNTSISTDQEVEITTLTLRVASS